MIVTSKQARFDFKGKLITESFIEFACHRAARLGIEIRIVQTSGDAIILNVSGAAELIDAFEMACSLGPYDCLVLDVARHDCELAA